MNDWMNDWRKEGMTEWMYWQIYVVLLSRDSPISFAGVFAWLEHLSATQDTGRGKKPEELSWAWWDLQLLARGFDGRHQYSTHRIRWSNCWKKVITSFLDTAGRVWLLQAKNVELDEQGRAGDRKRGGTAPVGIGSKVKLNKWAMKKHPGCLVFSLGMFRVYRGVYCPIMWGW